jgi:hypothetical protein
MVHLIPFRWDRLEQVPALVALLSFESPFISTKGKFLAGSSRPENCSFPAMFLRCCATPLGTIAGLTRLIHPVA